jgi:hypothetical protein
MTLAIPAWAIMDILEMPKFKQERERLSAEAPDSNATPPIAESVPSTKSDNP